MASGINSTFRQVGIATGIALLGSLFASRVRVRADHVAGYRGWPGRARSSPPRSGPATSGRRSAVCSGALPRSGDPGGLIGRLRSPGLNLILLVAAVIAFVSGAISLAAIRAQDFAHHQPARP